MIVVGDQVQLRAGARGYLLKGADEETIARALATVSSGDLHLTHAAAQHVLATLNKYDASSTARVRHIGEPDYESWRARRDES
ncbi:hypothetical protein [uncultured Jatrophihabitans sp.]|uniref:hypothetical protein n=1 Tax=uncultured Jatrophihabitans sp. TaxID=1610747 RepID=UPI0035CAD343